MSAALAGCTGSPGSGGAPFVDRSSALSTPFVYETGADGKFWFPEIMGAGAAVVDYDTDGDLDIVLPNAGHLDGGLPVAGDDGAASRLYRNDGDWHFADVSAAAGIADTGYSVGVATGDYDNDGHVDLYFSNYGPDRLYRNRGDGSFEDVTHEAGIAVDDWSASAAFSDYDADGDLDLYVSRYVAYTPETHCTDPLGRPDYCSPQNFKYLTDVLLQNDGQGHFVDVSAAAGITAKPLPGLGVAAGDFTGDGRSDFYVANDGTANLLWVNQGDGTFQDAAVPMGVASSDHGLPQAGMGVVAADLNGDSLMDLFVTNLTNESNANYRNVGAGTGYQDVSASTGVAVPSLPMTGFGVLAPDVDLDGDADLVVANGGVRLIEEPGKLRSAMKTEADTWARYAQPNQLFLNDGQGNFAEVPANACGLCLPPGIARGLAQGDLDGDGDLDLVFGMIAGPARLMEARTAPGMHWLRLRVLDPALKRDALGALLTVAAGGRTWLTTVDPDSGYLSSSDPRVTVGLGAATAVDSVTVRWPGGPAEQFKPACVDCEFVARRGEGTGTP